MHRSLVEPLQSERRGWGSSVQSLEKIQKIQTKKMSRNVQLIQRTSKCWINGTYRAALLQPAGQLTTATGLKTVSVVVGMTPTHPIVVLDYNL